MPSNYGTAHLGRPPSPNPVDESRSSSPWLSPSLPCLSTGRPLWANTPLAALSDVGRSSTTRLSCTTASAPPITPDQLVPTIDIDVILVAIAILAVLPRPAHRRILLLALGRTVGPGIGHLTALDLLIVVTTIALNGNRDNRSV